MKIIIEEGDAGILDLEPGVYVLAPESCQLDREYDYRTREHLGTFLRTQELRRVTTTLELRAQVLQREQAPSYTWGEDDDEDLLGDACEYCDAEEGHDEECPAGIAEQVPMSVNRCDNLNGPCSCGAWHSPRGPMTGRRIDKMIIDDVTGETPVERDVEQKRRQFLAAYGVKHEKLVNEAAPFRRGGIAKATGPCTIGNGEPEAFFPLGENPGQCASCQKYSKRLGKETPRCWACPESKAKRAAMPEPIYYGAPCPYVLKEDPSSSEVPQTKEQRAAVLKWFTEKIPTVKADVVYVDGNFKVPDGMVDRAIRDVIERNKDALRKALGVPMDKGEARKEWPGPPVAAKCDECQGSGEWENPANGRRSPCSRGCRP